MTTAEHYKIASVEVAIAPLTADRSGLSAAQIADVDSLSIDKRRCERISVYQLINRFVSPGALIAHHEDGTPYLCGRERMSFSLSHCVTRVAIAWSDDASAVGIDVEDPTERLSRVASRFVLSSEQGLSLHNLWMAKEAAFKAVRMGTLIDYEITRDFTVARTPDSRPLTIALLPNAALAYRK